MELKEGFISNPGHHTDEEERQLMKQDVIQLLISLHSCSRSSNPSNPTSTINDQSSSLRTEKLKTLIQQRLPSLLTTNFTTPTHPSYSVMVIEALKGLNQEGGSNEEAISDYIKTNFEDLPWAHSRLLNYHLNKLVNMGEIYLCSNYSLFQNPNPNPNPNKKRKRRRRLLKKCGLKTDHTVPSCDEDGDDDFIVLGDGNNLTAAIEDEPSLNQLPTTSIADQKSEPPTPPPVEEVPTVGVDAGPETIPSPVVVDDDNPAAGLEVVPVHLSDGDQTAEIEVGPNSLTSHEVEGDLNPTDEIEAVPVHLPPHDADGDQTAEIEVGPEQQQEQHPTKPKLRRGRSSKKREETIIGHPTVDIGQGAKPIQSSGADENQTVVTEVVLALQQQLHPHEVQSRGGGDMSMGSADKDLTVGTKVVRPKKKVGWPKGKPRKVVVDPTVLEHQKTVSDALGKRDTDKVQSCGGHMSMGITDKDLTVGTNGVQRKKRDGKPGRPRKIADGSTTGLKHQKKMSKALGKRKRGRPPKISRDDDDDDDDDDDEEDDDGSIVVPPSKKKQKVGKRGIPSKKLDHSVDHQNTVSEDKDGSKMVPIKRKRETRGRPRKIREPTGEEQQQMISDAIKSRDDDDNDGSDQVPLNQLIRMKKKRGRDISVGLIKHQLKRQLGPRSLPTPGRAKGIEQDKSEQLRSEDEPGTKAEPKQKQRGRPAKPKASNKPAILKTSTRN